jgi:hypothetical protein
MTTRVPTDALWILRAAAALADIQGPAAEALRDALARTDPDALAAIEQACEDDARQSGAWPVALTETVH